VLWQYSFVFIAPIGLFLGLFFPLGIRKFFRENPAAIPLAYAVNGAASVISPVLASLIAVEYGLRILLVLAAMLYAATLAMCSSKDSTKKL
jgi:H+/Cl- antiporter ClcA